MVLILKWSSKLKIVAISDTHNHHRKINIPEGDILIHSGDITNRGELKIMADFANWLQELPHKYKIVVFGNHEIGMSKSPKREQAIALIEAAGAIYLEDSGTNINGLKIWGSPVQPWFHSWEWNKFRGAEIKKYWDLIPEDTNVLITHGPPYNILDEVPVSPWEVRDSHQGCEELAERVTQLKELKLHCFGHLHTGGGKQIIQNNTIFANAAICTEEYDPTNLPIVVEI